MGKTRIHLVLLTVLALVCGVAPPASAVSGEDVWGNPGPDRQGSLLKRDAHGGTRPVLPNDALSRRELAPTGGRMAAPKRVRELVDRRTASARFFQLGDGRVEAELSAEPVHYRDWKGRWQPIDTTVRRSDEPGFPFGNTSNTFATHFGVRPDGLVRFERGGRRITLGLPGQTRALSPVRRGSEISYPNVFGDADVTYQVTGSSLKERIVLAKPPADPTFRFTVDTAGLLARQRPDCSIGFYGHGRDGEPLFVMPKPFMVDGRDDVSSPYGKVWSDKVTQSLEQHGSRLTVTVRADAGWLRSADRQYPVVVDPTIVVQPAPAQARDATINSGSPDTNYGSGQWKLTVGTDASSVRRALVKFDLSGIPVGQVDTAQLKVYYDQYFYSNANDVKIEARRVTSYWAENTVTWNTANGSFAEVGYNQETVDNSDTGKVAVNGSWPASTNSSLLPYAVNQTYQYNKNATTGESFTWVPKLTEDGDYQVDAHYVQASDRPTNAPYTVFHNGGQQAFTVDQSAGTQGVWKTLGTLPFAAGTSHKVVLGDVADATKSTVADAVRFTKYATDVKRKDVNSVWQSFSVRSIVQDWLNGAYANYGFMLKASDETLGRGGALYEAGADVYDGETAQLPKLVVTYGRPGVDLAQPTTIHATGAELSWTAYADPDPASSDDDIVEYQVHRGAAPGFTPSASTLVTPLDPGTTQYTDTSADPVPPGTTGCDCYYLVAVKTKDGQLIPSPTRLARRPNAGRTVRILHGNAADTTLTSAKPDQNNDQMNGDAWLAVGNNSTTYGTTRAVLDFGDVSQALPAGATVLGADLSLWAADTVASDPAQAGTGSYSLHALTRGFDETTGSWNRASTGTAWTTPGGDYDPAPAATHTGITSDPPKWHTWEATSIVRGWLTNPASDLGFLIKRTDETGVGERSFFLSSEGEEPWLRPRLTVTYTEKTTENTYYAPDTPQRMIPGDQYGVAVTLTNTTGRTWTAADHVLSYRWALPDGTDKTTSGNQVNTPLPKDMAPGETVTVNATVKTPIHSDAGNKREAFVLQWDLYNTATRQWLSQTEGIGPLEQDVTVEDPTSAQLGLERFYSYAGKNTGAGSTVMADLYNGNTVFGYNVLANPSRGPSTFLRLTYNSLDTSNSAMGYGWSMSASTLMRLGTPLQFSQPGQAYPDKITMTDGDGTAHEFTLNTHNSSDQTVWDYDHPAGVHLYLQKTGNADITRRWVLTRPDRTQFFFDTRGYQQAIVDKNGNTLELTYTKVTSHSRPIKYLKHLTDAAGRRTLTVRYYVKGEDYTYIDDTGNPVPSSNLTNPKIIDKVRSITDVSGRTVTFTYSDKGLLRKVVDGDGSTLAKTFRFRYDATQGNKNVKLIEVTDPRGHATTLGYYTAVSDSKDKWKLQTLTDRRSYDTAFAYTDPDGSTGSQIQAVVTDAENHAATYLMDGYGRPIKLTNAKSQVTQLGWDADNNVNRLEEDNGAVTTWSYDPNTGYPLETKDAEANLNNTSATALTYQTGLNGHVADLVEKTSPEGRKFTFGYDPLGNLKTVTDPKGNATATAGDYTTGYDYDSLGQLTKATDANGHATTYSGYDPTGYPKTITDAATRSTTFGYDGRGNVLTVTDANGKTSSHTYDVFGRPGDITRGADGFVSKVPKDQATGVYIITPAPVYDPNDNVTQSTAPNDAVTTAVYDSADQLTSTVLPADSSTAPERKVTYTYDTVGNVKTQTEPKGNLTPTLPGDFITSYGYDEVYQLTSATNAVGDRVSYEYNNVGDLITVIDPRKNKTPDATDFTTRYTYDRNHRVKTAADAAGKTTGTGYDRDGNVVSSTDKENNTTLITLDERAKPAEVKVPRRLENGTVVYGITRYGYDQVGNRTTVTTPRGSAADAVPGDCATAGPRCRFIAQTSYDELNRVKEQLSPYDPNDGRYNTPDKTIFSYDPVGRLSKVSAPPSNGQTVRNDTTYAYWDNGWTKISTDPWDIATSYNYNQLGQQTDRTLTSAGGSKRTMGWSYYPDGKLKTRSDDGVPVGDQVVLVDNSDVQNVAKTGTWPASGSGTGFQGYDQATHAAGTGTNTFTWQLNVPQNGTYTVYVKYATVSGAAGNAPYKIDHAGGSVTKTVNQSTGGGSWVSLGSYSFTEGNTHKITLSDNAGGIVVADAVKLVRVYSPTTDPDNENTKFTYAYDPNGNLTDITDASPNATYDKYKVTYTGLNQVEKVEEQVTPSGGGTPVTKHTTTYTYDENGNPSTRGHDADLATYTYDVRDLLASVSDAQPASDPTPKLTTFTYTARGQREHEVKGNKNAVDYSYFLDGLLRHQVERKQGGTLVAEHTLDYDPNGNKTSDVAKLMNADNHAAYLDRTTTYTYDPRDRLATLTKKDAAGATVSGESYTHDANNNVVSQTVKNVTTDYTYDRDRLLKATSGGATGAYNYDPFGRLDTVTSAGTILQRYTYDGFDRITTRRRFTGSGTTTTAYVYDPLDRTASETTNAGTGSAKTTELDYLGLTDQVLDERDVAGKITKSYQYSPWGERLSQVRHNTDGTTEDGYYGYNPHTDVETLTDAGGDTKATYGYTAYGRDDDADFTGIDKPTATDPTKEPYNPYRFNAKRFDPASGSYDMGFRDYDPGLNRFLTRDMYSGALADMALGADPWTANRYAFAGGNPVTGVELDGHCPADRCGYGSPTGDGSGNYHQTGPADPGNPDAGTYRDGVWSPPAHAATIGLTHITAPDAATYANAFQQALHDYAQDYSYLNNPNDRLPPLRCTIAKEGGLAAGACDPGDIGHLDHFAKLICTHDNLRCETATPGQFLAAALAAAAAFVGPPTGPGSRAGPAAKTGAVKQIPAAWGVNNYRHGGLMSTIDHINYRHAWNSGFSNVSRFAEGTSVRQIKGYVDDALAHGTVTQTGMGYSVLYDTGSVIGVNQAGTAVSGIQVYVRGGVIQTAFPVAIP